VLLLSLSSGWFGAAFDRNTPAVFAGNRIQTPKLSVSFSHSNLARFNTVVLSIRSAPMNLATAFLTTGGCATGLGIAYGIIGKSPNGNGKILSG